MKVTNSLDTYPYPPYLNDIGVKKSLTNLKRSYKIDKVKRKDQTMKVKKQLKIGSLIALVLLTLAGAIGITELIGGGLRDAVVGALLSGCLFGYVMEDLV